MRNLSIKTFLPTLLLLASTTACDTIPAAAYKDHGPESLIEQSSELVNFEVIDAAALDDLVTWVDQDQPSRAELRCDATAPNCMEAEEILTVFGVPTVRIGGGTNDAMVTLIYDRILARDCENRFVDNSINPYNLNHPTFGCSISSNMLQMVSDKTQFTRPALLGNGDAERLDRVIRGYRQPYNTINTEIDPNFKTELDIDTSSQ